MQEYSFKNLMIRVDNVPVTGWAEGDDVVQVSRRVDAFDDSVGADGRMLVYQNPNKSGQIVFRLQQGSEGNAYLNYKFGLQEGANGVFVPIFVIVKNLITTESAHGSQGYIKKPSDITRGVGVNAQEWTIVVEDLVMTFGPQPGIVGIPSLAV